MNVQTQTTQSLPFHATVRTREALENALVVARRGVDYIVEFADGGRVVVSASRILA